jgi:5-dehydro-4-deoxyglucarate dehydratase
MTPYPLAPPGAPLFFPITPFDASDRVDAEALHAHIEGRLAWSPSAVVAASGAGEFHAMSQDEVADVARIAVSAVAGRHPVLVGCGGPLGHARVVARAAEAAGAQGLLLMPPYLVEPMPGGMVAYVRAVTASSGLPVIVYHRGHGALSADDVRELVHDPAVAGIKDGVGDLALARQFAEIVRESARELLLLNGMPTAEVHHAAYAELGIDRYSSAVFTMAPEIAMGFHTPTDPGMRDALLREFFEPFVQLRAAAPGLAVALVKTGLRLRGEDVGVPRPPLRDAEGLRDRLAVLLERGTAIIRGGAR